MISKGNEIFQTLALENGGADSKYLGSTQEEIQIVLQLALLIILLKKPFDAIDASMHRGERVGFAPNSLLRSKKRDLHG
jgi:hypothetical protein